MAKEDSDNKYKFIPFGATPSLKQAPQVNEQYLIRFIVIQFELHYIPKYMEKN